MHNDQMTWPKCFADLSVLTETHRMCKNASMHIANDLFPYERNAINLPITPLSSTTTGSFHTIDNAYLVSL